jgi:hypothetical protein
MVLALRSLFAMKGAKPFGTRGLYVAGSNIRILLEDNPCCSAPLKKGGLAERGL